MPLPFNITLVAVYHEWTIHFILFIVNIDFCFYLKTTMKKQ